MSRRFFLYAISSLGFAIFLWALSNSTITIQDSFTDNNSFSTYRMNEASPISGDNMTYPFFFSYVKKDNVSGIMQSISYNSLTNELRKDIGYTNISNRFITEVDEDRIKQTIVNSGYFDMPSLGVPSSSTNESEYGLLVQMDGKLKVLYWTESSEIPSEVERIIRTIEDTLADIYLTDFLITNSTNNLSTINSV
jgi:hypothetical protein